MSESDNYTQRTEWGDVPSHWHVAPLNAFVSRVTYGFTNPMPTTDDGPFMVTAKDVHSGRIDYSTARHTSWDAYNNTITDKSRPRVNDILLTKDGSIGRVAVCDRDDICINQSVALIQPNEGTHARFLKYLLEAPFYQRCMERDSDGTTIKHIYITRVDKMEVAMPPLVEQRAIAHILGSLDDKLESNRRINETLEAMARAIFKAWFVDFDPVKAKAAGATSFRGTPQDVFERTPDQFVESALGPIPAGWDVVPIGDLVEVVGGGTPNTKDLELWEGGENPFCTPKDMAGLISPILLDTERHITTAGISKISSGQLPIGTVLLSSRAPIGYLAISQTPVSVNQGIIAMLTGEVPNTYVLLWTEENMEVIKGRAGGSTFAEINKRNFRPIPALRPDERTLAAFDEIVRPLFGVMAAKAREIRVLAGIRDTLLPKLMSGIVRVCR